MKKLQTHKWRMSLCIQFCRTKCTNLIIFCYPETLVWASDLAISVIVFKRFLYIIKPRPRRFRFCFFVSAGLWEMYPTFMKLGGSRAKKEPMIFWSESKSRCWCMHYFSLMNTTLGGGLRAPSALLVKWIVWHDATFTSNLRVLWYGNVISLWVMGRLLHSVCVSW